MLTLHWVKVEGFRSFTHAAQLQLDAPGLTYISGHNRVATALGANGVGKSTLFEAICWALFGKTSLGLRASDVVEWGGEQCEVWMRFDLDHAQHKLRRTWGPVRLELDGRPLAQEQLEQLIGYTYETFLFAVYHAQFGEFFCDLSPSRQLEVYTQVLGLDVWEELSDTAAALALENEKLAQRIEVALASKRGRFLEKREALHETEDHETSWWRRHLRELLDASVARREFDALLAKLQTSSKEPRDDLQDLELRVNETQGLERQVAVALGTLQVRLQELENLQQLPKKCPTCKQPVDRKVIEQHIKDETAALRQQITAEQERRETAQQQLGAASKTLREARERAAAHLVEEQRAASYTRERNAANKRLLATMKLDCPFDVTTATKQLAALQDEVDDSQEELAGRQQRVTDYRFWVTGFREIRLALIKTSLAQFEVATNSALAALGLGDWSIEYAVEGETKSGKLKRGFTLLVRSPHNDGAVPFAAWSGGEGQRLRLAITMGLSDLIQDFAGSACNVEIFDEPTAHLADAGVDDLLALLESRAQQRESAILLADHHVLEFGGFARVVRIVKDEQGSTLQ